jgi:cytochrome c-type biogenesis protein CcmH/NrfG
MDLILNFAKNYACFMLLLFLFSYLTPREEYRKYLRFFISALMAAVLLGPVFSLFSDTAEGKWQEELTRLEEELSDIEYQEKGENMLEQFLGEATEAQ